MELDAGTIRQLLSILLTEAEGFWSNPESPILLILLSC